MGMMGEDISTVPKEEYCDSTRFNPVVIKRTQDTKHNATISLGSTRNRHRARTGAEDKDSRSIAALRRHNLIMNLVSDAENDQKPSLNLEVLELAPSFEPQAQDQISFKPEFSPETIHFSQLFSTFRTDDGFSTESNLGSSLCSTFDFERSPLGSLDTAPFQKSSGPPFDIPPSQGSQPRLQRKLKSVSSEWRRWFVERQRTPPRKAARRKPIKGKVPLIAPRFSRGNNYNVRNVHQDSGTKSGQSTCINHASNSSERKSLAGMSQGEGGSSQTSLPRSRDSAPELVGEFAMQQTQQQATLERGEMGIQKPSFLKPHSDILKITLGSTTFAIYADFLWWHCPLLAQECQQTCSRELSFLPRSLQDVDMEVFCLFVNWLYMERVINKRDEPPFQQRTMGLYVIAKRLQMPRLANDAIDALEARRRMEGDIQTKAFHSVYDNTEDGDPLRRYITDVCMHFKPHISERHKKERYPDELNRDIFVASLTDLMKPEDGEIDTTKYHMKVEP
ncbi:hypothetical protein ONS95_008658 [Cadophora gregata]|uniref:uncharacterized protein n=1 Tax=Cadophora gregata TaxID=51156 RepID=UPI0026DC8B00|nr:uncharacterized protein ONS95_008658 [Cadophora gregata]KAK0123644.1 hypothetical protein ONS95_008658 [Cadophora gregata]KAK0129985.1 hypothetical protein ONS96_000525 [Cadophora gregata f. sp. sojae]